MELEAHMFEGERARARQICMENTLEADFAEAEQREQWADIKVEYHLGFMEEKRWDFITLVYTVDMMAGQEVRAKEQRMM